MVTCARPGAGCRPTTSRDRVAEHETVSVLTGLQLKGSEKLSAANRHVITIT